MAALKILLASIDWRDIIDRIISVFFPERCVLCGKVVAYDNLWCKKCGWERCGLVSCINFTQGFAAAAAAAMYAGNVREALLKIKEDPDKRALLFFAGIMRDEIDANFRDIGFDAIVPVPMSEAKQRERGFNQAESLARSLSGLIGIPVLLGVLSQDDGTLAQHTLTRSERRQNAEKAFGAARAELVRGKTVLLIDDIFTTGSTAAACSARLMEAGASSVYVLTAAATAYTDPQ